MFKKFFTAGIAISFVGLILLPNFVYAQSEEECTEKGGTMVSNGEGLDVCSYVNKEIGKVVTAPLVAAGNYVFDGLAKGVGQALMTFSAGILAIAGVFFDTVIKATIIDMATNIGNPTGLGGSITATWATLRDISNMAFIFVLLFAAFKAMFELNFGSISGTIKNIIIVALFINFSLFGVKVVIDASNIVAIGFYNSIRTGNSAQFNPGTGGPINFQGISGGYMRLIGLQSWFSSGILGSGNGLDSPQILIIGLMSSIFMLVTAVIFLISGVMFLSRFIILILVMVVAAPACVCYIIPGQKGHFDKWWETLKSQAAFAPLFFAMTWVTFRLASTPNLFGTLSVATKDFTNTISKSPSSVDSAGLILNFAVVMGLAIASLVFSKTVASKAAGFTALSGAMGVNKMAGIAGGVTFGGAAALGRRTLGAGASRLAQSQTLNNWAGKSFLGQKVKEGTERVAKSSFDVRQTNTGKSVLGATQLGDFGTGKTGGFDATLQAKTAKKEKVAASLRGDAAKEAYAARISRGFFTKGGSNSSAKSLFGVMGRHNRVVASKILNGQLSPLEAKEETLTNREAQLAQQFTTMQTEYNNLDNKGVSRTKAEEDRFTRLDGGENDIGSVAYAQKQLKSTQDKLTKTSAEANRIRDLIADNGLINKAGVGQATSGQIARMAQLQKQLGVVNRSISLTPGGPTPAQAARLASINTQITGLKSDMATKVAATANPALGVKNPQTGDIRGRRADEQGF